MAIWISASSLLAPCQCGTSGGHLTTSPFFFSQDTIYDACLWTHIEPSIGLVCSCLPIIRGIFPPPKLYAVRSRFRNERGSSGRHTRPSQSFHDSHYFSRATKSDSEEDHLFDSADKGNIALTSITVLTDIEITRNPAADDSSKL